MVIVVQVFARLKNLALPPFPCLDASLDYDQHACMYAAKLPECIGLAYAAKRLHRLIHPLHRPGWY
jgi:hypothetical protein